jgi:hypothetical protein
MIGIAGVGINAILGDDATPSLRALLGIGLTLANSAALSICILAAVFYAGAISPALVVRRTVVYGATAGVMLFAFSTIEGLVVELLMSAFPVNDRLASAVLGAACGLAVGPVRTRLEELVRALLPHMGATERASVPGPIARSI